VLRVLRDLRSQGARLEGRGREVFAKLLARRDLFLDEQASPALAAPVWGVRACAGARGRLGARRASVSSG